MSGITIKYGRVLEIHSHDHTIWKASMGPIGRREAPILSDSNLASIKSVMREDKKLMNIMTG